MTAFDHLHSKLVQCVKMIRRVGDNVSLYTQETEVLKYGIFKFGL